MTIAIVRGSRRAAAALILAGLAAAAGPAGASSLRINPVSVAVAPDKGSAELRLENADPKPVAVRVTALRWTEADGRDRTEPTRDLVVSPPIFTVAPGARQLIRVGFRNRIPGAAYRLIVEEIPGPRSAGTGISVLLKLDLPLYVIAARSAVATLSWAARRGADGSLIVEGRNSGTLHAQILAIEARNAAGEAIGRSERMGVVLPSSSLAWSLGPATGAPAELVVRTAQGEGHVPVRVAP
ncbi:MAG: molecular chaperone [Alphaproteobacteria bacterium]|nr:molecular chaperone [Alphaproteobacteria bacterium]